MKKAKIILAAVILLIAATLSSTLSSFVQGDQIPVDPKLTITSNEKKEAELTNGNVLQLQLTVPKPVVQPASETQATQSSEAATEESADQKPVQDVNNLGLEVNEKLVKTEGYFLHLPEGFQLVQSDDQQALEQKQDGLYYDAAKVTTDKINVMVQADLEKVPETTELKLTHVMDENPVGESEAFVVKKAEVEEAKKDEAAKEESADDEDLELLQDEDQPVAKAQASMAGDTSKYGSEPDWFPTTIPDMYTYMNTPQAVDVSNEAQFAAAYGNSSIQIINLVDDIFLSQSYYRDSKVIINGNGHTLEYENFGYNDGHKAAALYISAGVSTGGGKLVLQNLTIQVPKENVLCRSIETLYQTRNTISYHNIRNYARSLYWNDGSPSGTVELSGKITSSTESFISIRTGKSMGVEQAFPYGSAQNQNGVIANTMKITILDNSDIALYPHLQNMGGMIVGTGSDRQDPIYTQGITVGDNVKLLIDSSQISGRDLSTYGNLDFFSPGSKIDGSTIFVGKNSEFIFNLTKAPSNIKIPINLGILKGSGKMTINIDQKEVFPVDKLIADSKFENFNLTINANHILTNNYKIFAQNFEVGKDGILSVNVTENGVKNLSLGGGLKVTDPKLVEFVSPPGTSIVSSSPVTGLFNGYVTINKAKAFSWETSNASDIPSVGFAPVDGIYGWLGKNQYSGGALAIRTAMNNAYFGNNSHKITFQGDRAIPILLDDNLTDNRSKTSSHIITGKTDPFAFVRISGDSLSTSDNNVPLTTNELTKNFIFPEQWKGNYTVQADENGTFSYDLHSTGDTSRFFTAGDKVTATVTSLVSLGQGSSNTITARDDTAPTGNGKTMYFTTGNTTFPDNSAWVENLADSNPNNKKIVASWSVTNGANTPQSLAVTAGEYDVKIAITDDAGNSRDIDVKMIVKDKAAWVEAGNVFVTMDEISKLSDDDFNTELLNLAGKDNEDGTKADHAVGYRIDNTTGTLTTLGVADLIVDPLPEKKATPKDAPIDMTIKTRAGDSDPAVVKLTIKEWGPTPPKNPDNPGEDAPAKENGGTGATGALRLDYVPSLFDFGSVPFEYQEKTYNAKQTKDMTDTNKDAKQWVQVSDNQDVNKQWRLTVKQLANFNNSALDMTGTELQIPKGTLRNSETGAAEVTSGLTSSAQLILYPGSADQVIMASDGTVKNTSVASWDPTKVTLKVPAGYKAKGNAYTAGLQWTLNAVPTNQTP